MLDTSLIFKNISYLYSGSTPLLHDVTFHLGLGWTGVVGANGVGKTTLLKLACSQINAVDGSISRPEPVYYVEQRTDHLPVEAAEFFASYDRAACQLRGKLQIEEEWIARWDTLSHGERKRLQIAIALWSAPALLAVDEPTNHLDAEAKDLVVSSLARFPGIGLIVSHDREVLDELCHQCLYLEPPDIRLRPGGVTKGLLEEEREEQYASDQRARLDAEYDKLRRLVIKHRDESVRSGARTSKRGLARGDHDSRGRINAARITGKDAIPGRMARSFESRLTQVESVRREVVIKPRYEVGIEFLGMRSRKRVIASFEGGNYLLNKREVLFPPIVVENTDRIALTGRNGAGKSTLIALILDHLHIPTSDVVYIPQEVDEEMSRATARRLHSLPEGDRGRVCSLLSRLNSRPERVLESALVSPGEARKLLLCERLTTSTSVIILDEPTNHLDLPSVRALEAALSDFHGALIVVSHDRRFLENVCRTEWRVDKGGEDTFSVQGAEMTV